MRIGTLGFRTKTGLGYQALSYTKHLPVTKVMVVDLSGHNGVPLTNWYTEAQTVRGYPREADLSEFLKDIDVVLLAETPLNYDLYSMARARGIKTAVLPNWEFWDYYLHPEYPNPDLIIMPSTWRWNDASQWAEARGVKCIQIHHPVDREVFKFHLRRTKKFMHIAGKPAVYDRNGTQDYLAAVNDGVIITQNEHFGNLIRSRYPRSRVITDRDNPEEMYNYGDILVLPRRYGGNCLPLNEALSSGMPVIMPDIEPNNHLLPPEWLVRAELAGSFEPRTTVDLYSVVQESLREKLEWFRDCDIVAESQKADAIAEKISWDTLKPKYMEALEDLCTS